MKAYAVSFNGVLQGTYKAFDALTACRMAALDYGSNYCAIVAKYGYNYSTTV